MKIIVIDDELDILSAIDTILEAQIKGAQVITFGSAVDFLSSLDRDPAQLESVDCIVSDFDMPQVNGEELYIELQKREINKKFIIFSGRYSNNKFPELLVVHKPNLSELVAAITK